MAKCDKLSHSQSWAASSEPPTSKRQKVSLGVSALSHGSDETGLSLNRSHIDSRRKLFGVTFKHSG